MSTYKQLTYEQRCQIEALKKSGMSQQAIATVISVSQSSVSRELSRNRGGCGYRHKQAQQKALERRRSTIKPHKMTAKLVDEIEDKLFLKWSPEQISGWLLVNEDTCISHESIYRHVWADKATGGDLYKNLRRHARKYKTRGSNGKTLRGQIKNRVSIDDRPDSVDEKMVAGDWEIDTVIGKNHSGALVTIVERVTLFTVSKRVKSKRAKAVTAATIALLTPFKSLVRTITSDNGKEFAYHEQIAAGLECDFYFAHPYRSWERGLNENTNGLLRQYFPKSTDFKTVSAKTVRLSVNELNDRPRKTLAFKTPAVLMREEMAALAA
jgi:transposase, IS30 family